MHARCSSVLTYRHWEHGESDGDCSCNDSNDPVAPRHVHADPLKHLLDGTRRPSGWDITRTHMSAQQSEQGLKKGKKEMKAHARIGLKLDHVVVGWRSRSQGDDVGIHDVWVLSRECKTNECTIDTMTYTCTLWLRTTEARSTNSLAHTKTAVPTHPFHPMPTSWISPMCGTTCPMVAGSNGGGTPGMPPTAPAPIVLAPDTLPPMSPPLLEVRLTLRLRVCTRHADADADAATAPLTVACAP
jgi:hypothetical protein